jgi:hypothetical protein
MAPLAATHSLFQNRKSQEKSPGDVMITIFGEKIGVFLKK